MLVVMVLALLEGAALVRSEPVPREPNDLQHSDEGAEGASKLQKRTSGTTSYVQGPIW